jgi:putative glutamine amidotransferase
VIAVCAALEPARWSVWDQEAVLLPRSYITALQAAGALALLVAPDPALIGDPDELLDRVDGLVLAGGADIDPAAYDRAPHPLTVGTVPERDRFEIALARRAIERDLPLLGICRGMQVMNVARGGTLEQHLPDRYGHEHHRRVIGSFDGSDHDVDLVPGSLAARVAGQTRHPTKSHHHQGVDTLGEGFDVTGRSPLDDLVEAIEVPGHCFALGVQWHPEADPGSEVIAGFVRAAAERAASAAISAPVHA